jgi:hypothetical protein
MCGKPLQIKDDHPSFMLGVWAAKATANPEKDTVLSFSGNGKYDYSISHKKDSTTIDTLYWEKGDWNVTYIDENKNDSYDNGSEDNHLFTNAAESSKPENIGRASYSMFNYSVSGGKHFLEILADKDQPLTIFEKISQ